MDDNDLEVYTTRIGIKGNVRYITITDNQPEHWDKLISILKTNYEFWAYIYHDSDKDESGNIIPKHIHIVGFDKGGTTLKGHCDRFSSVVPSNFICKVKNGRAIVRYLVHKDQPQKFQYDEKLIETNNQEKLLNFFRDESDSISEYQDYVRVRKGEISVEDFIRIHKGELYNLNLYQKISLFRALEKEIYYEQNN